MTETDVLIVGAGPTGLTLGATLTKRGVAATVVDAQAAGENTSRACAIASRTLEVLERIDVSHHFVAQGIHNPRFSMRDRERVLIPIDFSTLPTSYPYTLTLSQADTERILLDRLTQLGGEVLRPRRLTGLTQDGESVLATFDNGEPISARYVVGADGMHSAVREAAGIGFEGAAYGESFILADAFLDWPLGPSEVSLFYAPEGLVVVSPLPNGAYRVVATVDQAPERPTRDDVQTIFDQRGPRDGGTKVRSVLWSSRFHVHHRLATAYRKDRLFVMGDAAHVHSPAGGQGMNCGLVDACTLGRLLAEIVAGRRPEGDLDLYEKLRRPAAAEVLRLAGGLTRMATAKGALRQGWRNLRLAALDHLPPAKRKLMMTLSGLSRRALAELPE
jgi:2-polyprenyl-6-methoxyphenol hydroxylase-like FAD-dependent oxidoreductase